MVYTMFVQRLGCVPDVARILTRLTTLDGAIPQGAPTSTMVANIVLEPLVLRVRGLADQHGAAYGQFVDDGTISGPSHLRRLLPLVKQIVAQAGFTAKESKTVCVDADHEQIVTGYRVNHQLDVPRKTIDKTAHLLTSMESNLKVGRTPSLKQLSSSKSLIRHISRTNKGAGRLLGRRLNRLESRFPNGATRRFPLKACLEPTVPPGVLQGAEHGSP
jgi:hypothetical protein